MSIKIRSRKNKGKKLQNYICQRLSDITGIPWGKDELIRSQLMGQGGTDVDLIGRAAELLPYAIECKNQESWSIHQWIDQATSNQKEGTDWLLFCKRNRKKPVVVMDAEGFFKLLEDRIKNEQ